jgi:hypothetical protein
MQQRTHGLKITGAFAAIYLLWGGTYLAIALGLQSIPALMLIASRSRWRHGASFDSLLSRFGAASPW